MPTRSRLTLSVVGGASGVGKTTLLNAATPEVPRFNTGTLFKQHMTIGDRDEIRKSDWSQYEDGVGGELSVLVGESFKNNDHVIIDTHFAAKLNGKHYRIGLKQHLIYDLGNNVIAACEELGLPVSVFILLINCNPHSLLNRRRIDKTRNRELIPSDCYNSLRENTAYSRQYLTEFWRARLNFKNENHEVTHVVIENDDLHTAKIKLQAVYGR